MKKLIFPALVSLFMILGTATPIMADVTTSVNVNNVPPVNEGITLDLGITYVNVVVKVSDLNGNSDISTVQARYGNGKWTALKFDGNVAKGTLSIPPKTSVLDQVCVKATDKGKRFAVSCTSLTPSQDPPVIEETFVEKEIYLNPSVFTDVKVETKVKAPNGILRIQARFGEGIWRDLTYNPDTSTATGTVSLLSNTPPGDAWIYVRVVDSTNMYSETLIPVLVYETIALETPDHIDFGTVDSGAESNLRSRGSIENIGNRDANIIMNTNWNPFIIDGIVGNDIIGPCYNWDGSRVNFENLCPTCIAPMFAKVIVPPGTASGVYGGHVTIQGIPSPPS